MSKKQSKHQKSTQIAAPVPQTAVEYIYVGAGLQRGNQTVQTWINNVKNAERATNPNRRFLYDTYLDISIDPYLRSMEDKRVRAVKTTPFEWEGLTNDLIIENFRSPWFFQSLGYMMEPVFKGHTLIEYYLGSDGLIGDCEIVPRQHVKPEKGLITKYPWGEESNSIRFREQPNSYYILETCKPHNFGLYMHLAPLVLIKRQNLGDFSRFNEMFGMPLRVYEYDALSPDGRDQAVQAARLQGSAGYVVLPKGTSVSFPEANKTGAKETFTALHEILNTEITITILGQSLTTSSNGKGSYALGNVHQAVERAINLEDRLSIEYLINYKMKNDILLPHGYPLDGMKGKFITPDELATEMKAAMWMKLADRGLPIAQKDFYNEFGVPMPGDGDPIMIVTKPTPPDDDTKPDDDAGDDGNDPTKDDDQRGGADKKKRKTSRN